MKYITDPRFFNVVILILYFLNCCRWAYHGKTGEAVYWFGAFVITYAVTFLMNK